MPSRPLPPIDPLEHEFAQEKASALGRLGRSLESALHLLREFDSRHEREMLSTQTRRLRMQLVEHASVALWHFAVQREACGLRDLRHVLRDYRVPAEVIARMGVSVVRNQGSGSSQALPLLDS
jgi:Family of unknown function (DUF6665)